MKKRPHLKEKVAHLMLGKEIWNIFLNDHEALLYTQKSSYKENNFFCWVTQRVKNKQTSK